MYSLLLRYFSGSSGLFVGILALRSGGSKAPPVVQLSGLY
jgi:xanthosine utilization system XapX-like protein